MRNIEAEDLIAENQALADENAKLRRWAQQAAQALSDRSETASARGEQNAAKASTNSTGRSENVSFADAMEHLQELIRQVEAQATRCSELASAMTIDLDGLSSGALFAALARKLDRLEGQADAHANAGQPQRSPRRPTKLPPRDAHTDSVAAGTERVAELV